MDHTKTSLKRAIVKHFFDFFMLFLAVTLGFFVDNFRDSYSANKTAHALAKDLVVDIAEDTTALHLLLIHCNIKLRKLDSLYMLIDDNKTVFNDSLIYYYSAYVGLRPWFERNNITFEQLTDMGYLDYFTKSSAASLTDYDLACTKAIALLENERQVLSGKIYPFQQQIFHTENFRSLIDSNKLLVKPELRNWNKDAQWLYHNYITEMKITNSNIKLQYIHLLQKGKNTISTLKKDYDIE